MERAQSDPPVYLRRLAAASIIHLFRDGESFCWSYSLYGFWLCRSEKTLLDQGEKTGPHQSRALQGERASPLNAS